MPDVAVGAEDKSANRTAKQPHAPRTFHSGGKDRTQTSQQVIASMSDVGHSCCGDQETKRGAEETMAMKLLCLHWVEEEVLI